MVAAAGENFDWSALFRWQATEEPDSQQAENCDWPELLGWDPTGSRRIDGSKL